MDAVEHHCRQPAADCAGPLTFAVWISATSVSHRSESMFAVVCCSNQVMEKGLIPKAMEQLQGGDWDVRSWGPSPLATRNQWQWVVKST